MPYPDELKKLIERLDKTRPERVARKKAGAEFPYLSLTERTEILRYHPDFREEGRRAIRVGVNRGYKIPHEVVDLLEARSRVDPDAVDLSKVDLETDVLVIGGGGAGTAAAILAQENGARVTIATKLRHGDSNSMMAEGGIQAAGKEEKDSPVLHYLDTMGGGRFKNVPALVYRLVNDGPGVIGWLEKLGVMFDKFPDGRLRAVHGGGTSRKRMYYTGDITGADIMRTLRDEARNRAGDIRVVEFSPAVELILNERGECAGALLYNLDTQEYFVARAGAVVLATGGCGRLHIQGFMTSNH
jgi:aspartate oxidase